MNNLNSSEVVRIKAHMAGTVVDMNSSLMPGIHVREGEELLTLERMKLFYTVSAPYTGVVTAVMAGFGSRVLEGEILFEMEVQGR
ncbi:MAG: acetyl-CoA carboxylase biotin carboxyl carrier protein subunit [Deltaproteobacteria bacterium]|nr:acetyl-CoA carboxylase biotin carboxyl carrier protein subunit [Deltaproteobacteria bacterium]